LFATQPATDFPKAINSYMIILTRALVEDINETYQRSISIIEEDSDKLFNMLIKNVLGMLFLSLLYIEDFAY
jgi:hypothetical protein